MVSNVLGLQLQDQPGCLNLLLMLEGTDTLPAASVKVLLLRPFLQVLHRQGSSAPYLVWECLCICMQSVEATLPCTSSPLVVVLVPLPCLLLLQKPGCPASDLIRLMLKAFMCLCADSAEAKLPCSRPQHYCALPSNADAGAGSWDTL